MTNFKSTTLLLLSGAAALCYATSAQAQWSSIDGNFAEISADRDFVWAVSANQEIKRRNVDGSGQWQSIGGTVRTLSASGEGWVWALQDGGVAWKCEKPCNQGIPGWEKVEGWPLPNDKLVQLLGDSTFVWGRTQTGNVYRRPVNGSGAWEKVPGTVSQLAVSGGNLIWGTLAGGAVYNCEKPCSGGDKTWQHVGGHSSAGGGSLSTSGDSALFYTVNTDNTLAFRPVDQAGTWYTIKGELKRIAASPSGPVWGVAANGKVFKSDRQTFLAEKSAADARASAAQQAAVQAQATANFSSQAHLPTTPYYQTLNQKSCEWGAGAYSWPIAHAGGVSLVTALQKRLNDYHVPPTRGMTGKYRYWYDYGAEGFNWVGDFDGDGLQQIASGVGPTIIVRENYPDFSKKTYNIQGPWGSPGYTWAGDFNGDGRTDIASAVGGNITMHLKTASKGANDGFQSTVWTVPGRWGQAAFTFAGDFNGDGKTDIASASGSTIHMSLSTGRGFTSATWQAPVAWGGAGYAWAGDFDGDGKADIAAATGGTMSIAYSTGAGFNVKSRTISNKWGTPEYTWATDFNRDGKTDIASANGCNVAYMRSTGEGFAPAVNWPLALPTSPRCSHIFADLGQTTRYTAGGLSASLPDYNGTCRR